MNQNIQNYQNLFKLRILQKNLIYVIGLAPQIADESILGSKEYFGQYGHIVKLMVNKNNAFNQNGVQGHSYSAYVTYSSEVEAIAAIQVQSMLNASTLITSTFTIESSKHHMARPSILQNRYFRYCQYFLKNIQCNNKQCLYVHELQDESVIYVIWIGNIRMKQ